MLLRKVVLMLALGLTCSSAMAEWTKVGDSLNNTMYANLASIRKDGTKAKMWILLDFKTAHVVGQFTYSSSMVQSEFDCKDETSRDISIVSYAEGMAKGEALFTIEGKDKASPVPPDSMGEDLLKMACDIK